MLKRLSFVLVCCLFFLGNVSAKKDIHRDDTIRQAIIAESIANYPKNCPCPYNRARNGSQCGKRSAYSKPGGYSPTCYETDITEKMLEEYKQKHHKN